MLDELIGKMTILEQEIETLSETVVSIRKIIQEPPRDAENGSQEINRKLLAIDEIRLVRGQTYSSKASMDASRLMGEALDSFRLRRKELEAEPLQKQQLFEEELLFRFINKIEEIFEDFRKSPSNV